MQIHAWSRRTLDTGEQEEEEEREREKKTSQTFPPPAQQQLGLHSFLAKMQNYTDVFYRRKNGDTFFLPICIL